jgi:hypothetical protein
MSFPVTGNTQVHPRLRTRRPGAVSVGESRASSPHWNASAARLCLLWIGALASGCSSGTSTSNVSIGPPAFTDVNGTPLKTAPTSLNAGQSAYLEVTLTNDPQLLGADWSVYCGSAPPPGTPPPPGQTQDQSCGTFTPVHTISGPVPAYLTSGSGYVTLYTAPAAPPAQGTVTLYAAATSNPSRWSSVTLSVIGLPVSVSFAPPPPATLATGASTPIKAIVNNDAANAGVVWTTICGSTDCGTFNPAKTASGIATNYTAPAMVPDGGTVQVIATSVTDPTKAASATISVTAATTSNLSGSVQASRSPVAGAQVSLYAARTSLDTSDPSQSQPASQAVATTVSDQDGNFSFAGNLACPSPDAPLYLLSKGGDAGGGTNPDLVFASAIGSCSKPFSLHFVINEATTIASIYALNGFIADETHVGSDHAPPSAIAAAFATANDLVDPLTGLVRARTVSGSGVVPEAKINTLASLLNACAQTAGAAVGDGSPCDELAAAVATTRKQPEQTVDTFGAILALARNPTALAGGMPFAKLYGLASANAAFDPILPAPPQDWSLSIAFPAQQDGTDPENKAAQVDSAGNLWVFDTNGNRIEFVGGARYAGALDVVVSLTAAVNEAH